MLHVINPQVTKSQVICTCGTVVPAAAAKPVIKTIFLDPTVPPLLLLCVPAPMNHLLPTNQNFVVLGIRFNHNGLVWHAESGEMIFFIDHQDICMCLVAVPQIGLKHFSRHFTWSGCIFMHMHISWA